MTFYTGNYTDPKEQKKKALRVSSKRLISFGIFGGQYKFRTCDPCSVNAGARQFCAAFRGRSQPRTSKNGLGWQQITPDYTGPKRKKAHHPCRWWASYLTGRITPVVGMGLFQEKPYLCRRSDL